MNCPFLASRLSLFPHHSAVAAFLVKSPNVSFQSRGLCKGKKITFTSRFSSSEGAQSEVEVPKNPEPDPVPIHLAEGLCAVYKPLDWTSSNVVAFIRGMLERDARNRGATLAKRRSRKSKKKVKVGHGGTLDPLATGVLVIGVGSGTKDLQKYLTGSKRYVN